MPFLTILKHPLLLLYFVSFVYSWTVETRRSTLFPWATTTDTANAIGWVQEQRDLTKSTYKVTVGCNDTAKTSVDLPFIESSDSLASSLWPPSLAGAILGGAASPPTLFSKSITNNNMTILELGAGLGLTGQVLAKTINTTKCVLTDKNEEIIALLNASNLGNNVESRYLEWRDSQPAETRHSFDIVLGTDVAYYYFLLRPLLNTIEHVIKPTNSSLIIVGQANRESQWDLFDLISKGGYNQETDQVEPAWNGTTKMLLYQLQMCRWQQHDNAETTNEGVVEGNVPIAVLVHATPGLLLENMDLLIHEWNHVANESDRDALTMSF